MKYVIIGAGPAGVTVAETLREYDDQSEIVMLTAEPYPPYSPPALLEYFLTGNPLHFWKGENFPERLELDYRSGRRVLQVVPSEKILQLDNGEKLAYERLVIASGGRLYAPLSGSDKEGIHNFKSLQAGQALMERVRSREIRTALIVGAGFIGVEVALMLQKMGLEVTLLVRSRPMRGILDPETSQIVQETLRSRGVNIREGQDADATGFFGEERAEGVQLRSGKELTADLLVAATGLKPNIEFLSDSGIATNWGVLVDDYLCAGSPDIYAVGDVSETSERLDGERGNLYPNYPNAVEQGRTAGYNLLGWSLVYSGAENINSLKHLGLPVMAAGSMEGEELRVCRNGNLRKLWVKEGRLVGFRLAGDVSCAGLFLNLIRRAVDISAIKEILLTPNFNISYLIGMAMTPGLDVTHPFTYPSKKM